MGQEKCEKSSSMVALAMVSTTVSDSGTADRLAGELVDLRIAACVQIDGPVRSVYRWKDAIEVETEYRLTIKTRSNLTASVIDWLAQHHPYEEPELIVTAIAQSSSGYARWVAEQTGLSG